MPELVTVASFGTSAEAAIARSRVEAEGISAYLTDEEIVDAIWAPAVAIGGVKLQVNQFDADRAVSALQSKGMIEVPQSEWQLTNGNKGFSESLEGSNIEFNVGPSAKRAVSRAFRAAIFGLIMPPFAVYSLWLLLKATAYSTSLNQTIMLRMLLVLLINALAITFYTLILSN